MKKLFALLTVVLAVTFISCGEAAPKTEEATDSTMMAPATDSSMAPAADTMMHEEEAN